MKRTLLASIFAVALPAHAEPPPPAVPPVPVPDPELLVFLGQMGGEDADFIQFAGSRDAKTALKRAQPQETKEDRHE